MNDPANYPEPEEFHGFRFVEPELLESISSGEFQIPQPGKPSRLTDTADWQVWGTGRMAW